MFKTLSIFSMLILGITMNSQAQQDCQEIKVVLEKPKPKINA
ncbi:hypothetical protein M2408_004076 [Sphingobacterium sp. BIGb0165]|nr:hypothetical protein [Sphingobacterium sp. BIGb0165]